MQKIRTCERYECLTLSLIEISGRWVETHPYFKKLRHQVKVTCWANCVNLLRMTIKYGLHLHKWLHVDILHGTTDVFQLELDGCPTILHDGKRLVDQHRGASWWFDIHRLSKKKKQPTVNNKKQNSVKRELRWCISILVIRQFKFYLFVFIHSIRSCLWQMRSLRSEVVAWSWRSHAFTITALPWHGFFCSSARPTSPCNSCPTTHEIALKQIHKDWVLAQGLV